MLDETSYPHRLTGQVNQSEARAMTRRYSPGFGEDAAKFQRPSPAQAGNVREVQASVAKTHFSQLLDEVERGATVVILRHGRPIARLVPDEQRRRERRIEALANLKKLGEEIRARHGGLTVDEIISSIHEGHKY
jgi:prevent-host-death family protein